MGGTLFQDITAEIGAASQKHMDAETKNSGSHEIAVEKGSLLHSVVKTESLFVNSVHHQSVAGVGGGLAASGRAADGVIEAIESQNEFILGVQWHPELLAAADPRQDAIFAAFAEECARVRAGQSAA